MKIKATNKRLFRIIQVMIIIGTLVSANVLFTMVTKTHIWTGHNVLDSRISNSIVHTTVSAKRGEILDRNGTVIAQDTTAYTVIAYVDSSNVDANGKAVDQKQNEDSFQAVLTKLNLKRVTHHLAEVFYDSCQSLLCNRCDQKPDPDHRQCTEEI